MTSPESRPRVEGEEAKPGDLNVASEVGKAEGWGTMTEEQAVEAGGVLDLDSEGDMRALGWCIEASWQRMRHHACVSVMTAQARAENQRLTAEVERLGLDRKRADKMGAEVGRLQALCLAVIYALAQWDESEGSYVGGTFDVQTAAEFRAALDAARQKEGG